MSLDYFILHIFCNHEIYVYPVKERNQTSVHYVPSQSFVFQKLGQQLVISLYAFNLN